MTVHSVPSVTAAEAADVVRAFFDAYRQQDVEAMVDMCSDNALFSYVPFEMWLTYSEPHVFLLHVDGDGKIDSITGYWDNASIYRQLGHLEVD